MEEIMICLAAGEGILLLWTMGNMHRIKRIEREIHKSDNCAEETVVCEGAAESREAVCDEAEPAQQIQQEENVDGGELIDSVLREIFP